MLNFTTIERATPNKRDVLVRIKDYDEVYEVFGRNKSKEQASRCMQCGVPYCHNKCPLHNVIPSWLLQRASDNLEEAFLLSNQTSPFPEILGKICPHDVLCEGSCSLNEGHGAVAIGAVEAHINEKAFASGLKPQFSSITSSKKVAIIGSGPAGISAATFLLRAGIAVEMFEREDRAGGLLTYGIPGFKLDKNVVQRRVQWLIEAGMKLHLNCEVGKDIAFSKLEKEFDAVFLGIGATKSNSAKIEGEDAKGVHFAIDFLTQIQKRNFGVKSDNFIDVKDKKVVVIGGGDTAMDCVRSAIREGATWVKCLYRRDEDGMPGSKKEFLNSKEEGVEFIFNVSPSKVVAKDKKVVAVELQKTQIVDKKVEIVKDSNFTQECDVVILALGFISENPKFLEEAKISTNSWGTVEIVDFKTTNPKVYAGGDCQRGAHLAVTAAADGREAAKEIIKTLI